MRRSTPPACHLAPGSRASPAPAGSSVYDVGAEELPKPPQCHGFWDTIVMPEGVERLGDHQIGHDHLLPSDQRAFDPPTGGLHLQSWLTDEQAKHYRGIKPDGHRTIPGRYSDGCRSTDATSPSRTAEGKRPRTSRAPAPSRPTPSLSRGADARPRPLSRERGRVPCKVRQGEWPGLGGDRHNVHGETLPRIRLTRRSQCIFDVEGMRLEARLACRG